jgi:hypothetical protein
METIWALAAGVLLGTLLAASTLHQLRPRWWNPVARLDALNLLPRWSFFAPNPGRHDLHLVYRDFQAGKRGPWQPIRLDATPSRWRWCWNPARYPRKAMLDLANWLLQAAKTHADQPRAVMLSGPYLGLLSWVMAQPASQTEPRPSHRQFAVIASQGFGAERRIEVRYLSEIHRVEA